MNSDSALLLIFGALLLVCWGGFATASLVMRLRRRKHQPVSPHRASSAYRDPPAVEQQRQPRIARGGELLPLEQAHACEPPGTLRRLIGRIRRGRVWRCWCGRTYELRHLEDYVANDGREVMKGDLEWKRAEKFDVENGASK